MTPTYQDLIGKFDLEAALSGSLVRRKDGKKLGGPQHHGHLRTWCWGKNRQVHRLIYCMANGLDLSDIDGEEIDHINHVSDDNRPENLRLATHAQNMRNQRAAHAGFSNKHLNVNFNKTHDRWTARGRDSTGKRRTLGYFKTEAEAVRAAERFRREVDCPFSATASVPA